MVSLVPLTTEDGATLEKIHKACFPDGWDHETFDQLLRERFNCGWMAISIEHLPIGFILARMMAGEAEILTFAVLPSMQRAGVGRYLLKELMIFLKSINCPKIFLEVAIDNEPAIALYHSMDFYTIGTRPNYYKRDSSTFISAFIMAYEDRI
jgi:ribosomal-protein-alanine N-acetyltransferase